MKLRRLSSRDPRFAARLAALTRNQAAADAALERRVRAILADVRRRGDAAVLAWARRFDGVRAKRLAQLEIPARDLRCAPERVAAGDARTLRAAAARIRRFHERQRLRSWSYAERDGTRLGQRVGPIARVGLYVPGGKAAYPSTVLMNAIPAKVAGVPELIMVSPKPGPLVLAAAAISGVDRVIAIGGAQAIAALAYGTRSIPRVDKIVGPGNAWVAAAKRAVFGEVGIDMIAGPSEILVIADASAPADWVALDLFSQAEHDEQAQAILLSPSTPFLDAVERAIERLLPAMPRRGIIEASLRRRGALIRTRSLAEACEIADRIAPEHLELAVARPRPLLSRLRHAGAVFLGGWSSEAIGDYCAGPNHVLPTGGTARFSSPLGVYDFQKRSSVIEISRRGARSLGRLASRLARGEGFIAHARAAELRL